MQYWSKPVDKLPEVPVIKYNLKERGRKYRGQDRNFNIKALVDAINGPEMQEMVKTRGMVGYYGHLVRKLAGCDPTEAVISNGKLNEIEPAIVTTYLKASYDGTVEHKTEFLNTPSGWKAARAWSDRIGGFSSAIIEKSNKFFGFDYVLEPNYSTNRGFTFDSVGDEYGVDEDEMTLDQVAEAVEKEEQGFIDALIAKKDEQIALLATTLDNVQMENEHLIDLLSKCGHDPSTIFDSISFSMPDVIDTDPTISLLRNVDEFRSASLEFPKEKSTLDSSAKPVERKSSLDMLLGRLTGI
jgi:hypothetical protein